MNSDCGAGLQLSLRRFGVAYDARVVHADLNWDIRTGAVHLLYGAAGSGKSTLLKALGGWQRRLAAMRVWGSATLAGLPLAPGRAMLVHQALGFFVATVAETLRAALPGRELLTVSEQRRSIQDLLEPLGADIVMDWWDCRVSMLEPGQRRLLSLCLALLNDPSLLMLDEPTVDCSEQDARMLRFVIERCAPSRVVIVATHDQSQFARFDRAIAHVIPPAPADFRLSAAALGGPVKHPRAVPLGIAKRFPSGFHWVLQRRLIALARPGLLSSAGEDLELLSQQGVTHLFCLEEAVHYDLALVPAGIEFLHYPIVDMSIPSDVAGFRVFLADLLLRLDQCNGVLAVHCKAGLGRTGLVCACLLVMMLDLGAAEAVEQLRRLEARFVQTEEQADFVESFCALVSRSSGGLSA